MRWFLAILIFCSFNAKEVAKEETAAWKDYYEKDVIGLASHLAHLMVIQFEISPFTAWVSVIPELTLAAKNFKNLPSNTTESEYKEKILPHLIDAYTAIKETKKANWEPKQAAELELEWWIYRRNSKTYSPEIVGKKIAELYSVIFEKKMNEHFYRAGLIRAIAARYRDINQYTWNEINDKDWQIIENLLNQSYEELLKALK